MWNLRFWNVNIFFSRTVPRATSMCTTMTHKPWWTGIMPSDAVNCIYYRFSWQWWKITKKINLECNRKMNCLSQLYFLPDDYMFQVAYPSESESELLEHLSQDYIKEVNCFQKSKYSFSLSWFSGILKQNGAKSKGCVQTEVVHSWGQKAYVPCWHALRLC